MERPRPYSYAILAGALALVIGQLVWGAEPPESGSSLMTRFYTATLDDAAHPLWPGTAEAQRELGAAELHGADVTVQGKYYPGVGAILVNRIATAGHGAK